MTSSSGAYAIVKNAVRNNADNEIAEIEGLGPLAERARQLRAVVDAYVLSAKQRLGFVDRIVEFAVFDTAAQADDAGVTHEPKEYCTGFGGSCGELALAPGPYATERFLKTPWRSPTCFI